MRRERIYVAVIIALAILFVASLAWAIYQSIPKKIGNHGVIRAIGVDVYTDETLTEMLLFIEWGMCDPGENKSHTAWVKNTGNDAQKLVMWTEAWNPSNASDWISLTWDYDDSWIPVNGSIPVGLTLHVGNNALLGAQFSFDIWVKGVH